MMNEVVCSSRSATGTLPFRPSPLSSSALMPPARRALAPSVATGVAAALNVGLVMAVYVAAAVTMYGTGLSATAATLVP